MIDLAKLTSLSDWPAIRTKIEQAVVSVLGPMPKEKVELQTKTIDEMQFSGFVRRRINYFVDEWERVGAWLFIPDRKEEMPGVLCCHDSSPQGKDEAGGLEGDPLLAFAQHYAELGYITLAPDSITTGDRISAGLAPLDTKAFYKDNPKWSAMGKMLFDHMCAIDALCEVKRVDSARLGVVGHGMGAQNALLLSAFDERVQTCVASCGFTRFANDKEPERWLLDDQFVSLPLLKEAVKSKTFPFDWEHVLALGAPSPTLIVTALNDERFTNAKSCEKAVQTAGGIYKLLGASPAVSHYTHNGGHHMTVDALQIADEWFERWL